MVSYFIGFLQLFYSFFKSLVGKDVVVELKNDLRFVQSYLFRRHRGLGLEYSSLAPKATYAGIFLSFAIHPAVIGIPLSNSPRCWEGRFGAGKVEAVLGR